MDKILKAIGPILDKLSFRRTLMIGLVTLFGVSGFIGYQNSDKIGTALFGNAATKAPVITKANEKDIQALVSKYSSVAYLTVLKFNFERNTRVPIYRSFNDLDLQNLVMGRLAGGDGALPIFIKNDSTNNAQMISIIQGTAVCDPFENGGLARVWPDLVGRLKYSCRVSIPPAFGAAGTRGYLVVHMSSKITPYELEALNIDLHNLANQIYVSSFGGTLPK